jgi:glycosyltransferase involved in cell wall biosynthesis
MRVQLVDPSGDVTPYDQALAEALARQGADVELVSSRFVHGPRAAADGYEVSESFYRRATSLGAERPRLRRALKLAEHVPDMLRYRRHAAAADVRHYQWLPIEALDAWLLPPARPRVMTVHNVVRRERSSRRLAQAMDALVVHTKAGAQLLAERTGVDPERIHVIPHGAFEHLTRQPDELPLPGELAGVEGPVVLCLGVIRPYKGVELLLDAFRQVEGAELWVVGRPLGVSLDELRARGGGARAGGAGHGGVRDGGLPDAGTGEARVRFVPRYVSDTELPALLRRADLLVLPHRSVDVSGVLFAGLAFGKAMVLSDVGGFGELAREHGLGRLVAPEDPGALARAITELLARPDERAGLEQAARAAAEGPFSWDRIAARTLELYAEVGARG